MTATPDPRTTPETTEEAICTKRPVAGTLMTAPCDECGHTTLLHPSSSNPALTECLVCRIEALS